MHQETKLDPPGSHALRVLSSGSERMQTAKCRALRGFGSWLPYFPVLPHWANSFRPAGAGAGALPSDSRSHRRELRLLQSMKTHAGAQNEPVEIRNDPLPNPASVRGNLLRAWEMVPFRWRYFKGITTLSSCRTPIHRDPFGV